jgi:hypothetical protein
MKSENQKKMQKWKIKFEFIKKFSFINQKIVHLIHFKI